MKIYKIWYQKYKTWGVDKNIVLLESSNLSDYQVKIVSFIYRLLYMNLMVTKNQKLYNRYTKNEEKEIQTLH